MADGINYVATWPDETTQCKTCKQYQNQDNKHACVPESKTFEEAISLYGEVSPAGHCNYYQAK